MKKHLRISMRSLGNIPIRERILIGYVGALLITIMIASVTDSHADLVALVGCIGGGMLLSKLWPPET